MTKEEKEAKLMYDDIADFYHSLRTKDNPEGWFYNELLEMPATLSLLGNIKNKEILDYGCGTGIYIKELVKRGAKVKAFDLSKEMIRIAKEQNPGVEIKQGSGYKIPYNEKFDIVLAPLVIHYMKDWNKAFREVKRVLKKGGYFIFSSDNPVFKSVKKLEIGDKKYCVLGIKDYFKENVEYTRWKDPNGKNIVIPYYHKTYETVIKTTLDNGFEIIDYKDCYPDKKAKKLFPKEYDLFSKTPKFCVWKVRG